MEIKKPRGTIDIFGSYLDDFQYIENIFKNTSELYNYKKIETPIFEEYRLFSRNENDSSDMVNKEMYVFKDKGDRLMALRPEGTAPVIRSVIEEKMLDKSPKPIKFYYISKMFRYERPQSGRLRQFHQYGIELIDNDSIYNEIQAMLLAIELLKKININNYTLKINYIGNFESRNKWNEALKEYFKKHINSLSEDSKNRIDRNPLRILDDKIDGKKDFVLNAPTIDIFLTNDEKEEISLLKKILSENNIMFEFDNKLVRGLDYYTGVVFEIVSNSEKLQGQSTLIGGGRYSKLFSEIGVNKDVTCFGFAAGIERILIAFRDENINIKTSNDLLVYIANISSNNSYIIDILNKLRESGISCDSNFLIKKIDKHFKYAEKFNTRFILIIGDKEIANNNVVIKDQKNMREENISINKLVSYIKERG